MWNYSFKAKMSHLITYNFKRCLPVYKISTVGWQRAIKCDGKGCNTLCTDLDLWGVKVHGDDVVSAGHRQHVCHQLGRYGCSTLGQASRHSRLKWVIKKKIVELHPVIRVFCWRVIEILFELVLLSILILFQLLVTCCCFCLQDVRSLLFLSQSAAATLIKTSVFLNFWF